MDVNRRNRAVAWIVPLVLALVVGRRAMQSVRTVDFLQILAVGMIVGISLANIIGLVRTRSAQR